MSDKRYDKAWKLLSDPSKWTQDALARDIHGERVFPCDPAATKWCVNGAVMRVNSLDFYNLQDYQARQNQVFLSEGYLGLWKEVGGIPEWNNEQATHAEIVEKLKKYDL